MFGTIKRLAKDKGFGVIVPDDGSDAVVFHRSRVAPKVSCEDRREGDEYPARRGGQGPQALAREPR